MADRSLSELLDILRAEFGETLSGPRDEGLDKMAETIAERTSHDRESVEAALAELVEQDSIRYIDEPADGVGAGIVGALNAPTAAEINPMEGGRPLHGAVAASQTQGEGHWRLAAG